MALNWTPAGDAFIIGSDLKRLESETLPQYFRHNRFQSLVRQLNFYSFRKINRERNVWIYKHELFHRERPEDLHLVRRRTCPGLDGRKQRFSRYSARKLTDDNSGSDEESSVEASSPAPLQMEVSPESESKRGPESKVETEDHKKRRRIWNFGETVDEEEQKEDVVVDTSLMIDVSVEKKIEEVEEELSQKSPVNERTEMAERSLIISQVAKKLDQYARKAFGSYGTRTRRQSSGVVTPPFPSLPRATNLLTYDDEFREGNEPSCSLGVITDGDESTSCGEEDLPTMTALVAAYAEKISVEAPAGSPATARAIAERLVLSGSEEFLSKAAVVSFCVVTSPCGDKDIGSKILQLIASCDNLEAEFRTYRAALDPFAQSDTGSMVGSYQDLPFREASGGVTIQQTWAREASRSRAVHDFTVFAVNSIHNILGKGGAFTDAAYTLTDEDKAVLERTILVWSKNA